MSPIYNSSTWEAHTDSTGPHHLLDHQATSPQVYVRLQYNRVGQPSPGANPMFDILQMSSTLISSRRWLLYSRRQVDQYQLALMAR